MTDDVTADLWKRAHAMQHRHRKRERLRNGLRWPAWTTVILLSLAAIGVHPIFTASRWSGAVMGLVLAIAALGLCHNADGTPVLQDGMLPPHHDDGMLLAVGCFVLGLLLAVGPTIFENHDAEDYRPIAYDQIIRLWTLMNVGAALLYATVMRRLGRHWHEKDVLEDKAHARAKEAPSPPGD